MKRLFLIALSFLMAAAAPAFAVSDSTAQKEEYRLSLEILNVTNLADYEYFAVPNYEGRTLFADTFRPVLSIQGEHVGAKAGMIAQKTYGAKKSFDPVDAYIQFRWKARKDMDVYVGNLEYPQPYLKSIFSEVIPIESRNHQTGVQVIHRLPDMRNEGFFNYYRMNLPPPDNQKEKFDWGLLHASRWGKLKADFQLHWIHEGGQLDIGNPISTVNDSAVAMGGGWTFYEAAQTRFGLDAHLLHGRRHVDSLDPVYALDSKGQAYRTELVLESGRWRWGLEYWRNPSRKYAHENAQAVYTGFPTILNPNVRVDILRRPDARIFAAFYGYLVNNETKASTSRLESACWLQAAWRFDIPIYKWTVERAPGAPETPLPSVIGDSIF